VVGIAAKLKGLGNRLCDVVAGRTTHPVSIQVGGMAMLPDKKKLAAIRQELEAAIPDLHTTADLFHTFKIPPFARETEFVSLKGEKSYPWIGGRLLSTDKVDKAETDYLAMTNEFLPERGTSKYCKLSRSSFAVGALARFNNNYELLVPLAKTVAESFGLKPVCHNPYMHNVAQLVETVHVVVEILGFIDEILGWPEATPIMAKVQPKAGRGVGAVEVPRGILYHDYTYDAEGRITKANCIIPTTQNHNNIQDDMVALVEQFSKEPGMSDKQLELLCSMLVRAYDPCISCSVH
jgi:sulfhydrogenase subunit alpha